MLKILRTFILKLTNKQSVKEFENFQKLAIFRGLKPVDAVNLAISKYNFHHAEKRKAENMPPLELVGEVELLEILKKKGISVTKVTLKKWRDKNILIDEDENQLWGSDGYSIVYDLRPTLAFIKRRKQSTTSRLSNGGVNEQPRAATE